MDDVNKFLIKSENKEHTFFNQGAETRADERSIELNIFKKTHRKWRRKIN
jgi:hypothetical protein